MLFSLFLQAALLSTATSRPDPSPPSIGALSSGKWRNVFVEAGYQDADITSKLASIVTQLFEGDPNNQRVIYNTTQDSSYLEDIANNDVRSEGMSYGMMAAVQLNLQPLFNRLFSWYKTHMQHTDPTNPRYGYSSWHCQTSGQSMDDNPASDGETFFTTALIFAAKRWGDAGAVNYTKEAQLILSAMIGKQLPPCGAQGCQSVTNMFGGFGDSLPALVRFVPYASAASYTDPSYVTPAFYEIWSRFVSDPVQSAYWKNVSSVGRRFFHAAADPSTGLMPDYATFEGRGTNGHENFAYDAWRAVRNVAVDYAWMADDNGQIEVANRLLSFFRKLSSWPSYGNQFTLGGNQVSGDHSPGLVAMNAVAALASNQSIAWDFVDALWNTPTPTGRYRYYDGVLYLEAFLHLSGNYRAWI